jgi:hypothetical protein
MSAIYTPETPNPRADEVREIYGINAARNSNIAFLNTQLESRNALQETLARASKFKQGISVREQERVEAAIKRQKFYDRLVYFVSILAGLIIVVGLVYKIIYDEYYKYYEKLCDRDATQCYWGTIHCNIKECCIRIETYRAHNQIVRLDPPCNNLQTFEQ